jgi:hypothetical protein
MLVRMLPDYRQLIDSDRTLRSPQDVEEFIRILPWVKKCNVGYGSSPSIWEAKLKFKWWFHWFLSEKTQRMFHTILFEMVGDKIPQPFLFSMRIFEPPIPKV